MGTKIDREGDFRGLITEFTIQPSTESQALMLVVKGSLEEHWDGENWEDWTPYMFEAYGSFAIALKDGSINQKMVDRIMDATGWNGDLGAVMNGGWTPQRCKMCVKNREYTDRNGVTKASLDIAFLDPYDGPPSSGGLRKPDASTTNTVLAKYSQSFRAYAASRNRGKAQSVTPPLPQQSTVPPTPPAVQTPDDEIPF